MLRILHIINPFFCDPGEVESLLNVYREFDSVVANVQSRPVLRHIQAPRLATIDKYLLEDYDPKRAINFVKENSTTDSFRDDSNKCLIVLSGLVVSGTISSYTNGLKPFLSLCDHLGIDVVSNEAKANFVTLIARFYKDIIECKEYIKEEPELDTLIKSCEEKLKNLQTDLQFERKYVPDLNWKKTGQLQDEWRQVRINANVRSGEDWAVRDSNNRDDIVNVWCQPDLSWKRLKAYQSKYWIDLLLHPNSPNSTPASIFQIDADLAQAGYTYAVGASSTHVTTFQSITLRSSHVANIKSIDKNGTILEEQQVIFERNKPGSPTEVARYELRNFSTESDEKFWSEIEKIPEGVGAVYIFIGRTLSKITGSQDSFSSLLSNPKNEIITLSSWPKLLQELDESIGSAGEYVDYLRNAFGDAGGELSRDAKKASVSLKRLEQIKLSESERDRLQIRVCHTLLPIGVTCRIPLSNSKTAQAELVNGNAEMYVRLLPTEAVDDKTSVSHIYLQRRADKALFNHYLELILKLLQKGYIVEELNTQDSKQRLISRLFGSKVNAADENRESLNMEMVLSEIDKVIDNSTDRSKDISPWFEYPFNIKDKYASEAVDLFANLGDCDLLLRLAEEAGIENNNIKKDVSESVLAEQLIRNAVRGDKISNLMNITYQNDSFAALKPTLKKICPDSWFE